MKFRVWFGSAPIAVIYILLFIAPSVSHAAAGQISAVATHVEGRVSYVPVTETRSYPVQKGSGFKAGDKLTTAKDGKAEIKFGTGDYVLMDNDSNMVIKSLRRAGSGTTSIILDLMIGRVKSLVSSLANARSRFEIHTRSAITGVAGTEFVTRHKGKRTDVYNTGDKGKVVVTGFDEDRTAVTLIPGMGTRVIAGLAPLAPFILNPAILKGLGDLIFHTGGGAGAAGGSAGGGAGGSAGGGFTGMSATTMAAIGGGVAVAAVAASSGGGGGGGGGAADSSGGETASTISCAADYAREACDLLRNTCDPGAIYVEGADRSACSSFGVTNDMDIGDFNCSSEPLFTSCGICVWDTVQCVGGAAPTLRRMMNGG